MGAHQTLGKQHLWQKGKLQMCKWIQNLWAAISSSNWQNKDGSRACGQLPRPEGTESDAAGPYPEPIESETGQLGDVILWHSYEATVRAVAKESKPVLAFVMDHDGICWPFLNAILAAMPDNKKLRDLLNGPCVAMLLKAESLPSDMAALGAGANYHIAILAPAGLTPIGTFDYITGDPKVLVCNIADVLERVAAIWAK